MTWADSRKRHRTSPIRAVKLLRIEEPLAKSTKLGPSARLHRPALPELMLAGTELSADAPTPGMLHPLRVRGVATLRGPQLPRVSTATLSPLAASARWLGGPCRPGWWSLAATCWGPSPRRPRRRKKSPPRRRSCRAPAASRTSLRSTTLSSRRKTHAAAVLMPTGWRRTGRVMWSGTPAPSSPRSHSASCRSGCATALRPSARCEQLPAPSSPRCPLLPPVGQ